MRRPAPCAGDIRLTRFEFHIFPSEKSIFSRSWSHSSARLRSARVDQQLLRAPQGRCRKAVIFGSAIGPLPWRTRLLKRSRTSMPSRFSAAKLCGRTGSRGSFDHPFVGNSSRARRNRSRWRCALRRLAGRSHVTIRMRSSSSRQPARCSMTRRRRMRRSPRSKSTSIARRKNSPAIASGWRHSAPRLRRRRSASRRAR